PADLSPVLDRKRVSEALETPRGGPLRRDPEARGRRGAWPEAGGRGSGLCVRPPCQGAPSRGADPEVLLPRPRDLRRDGGQHVRWIAGGRRGDACGQLAPAPPAPALGALLPAGSSRGRGACLEAPLPLPRV